MNRLALLPTLFVMFALASCSRTGTEPAAESREADLLPRGQLPAEVSPLSYRIELTVLPGQDEFSGRADIEIEIHEALQQIWLHGRDLTVSEAGLRLENGDYLPVEYEQHSEAGVAQLRLPRVVQPQKATLEFHYVAPFSNRLVGLYKVVEEERAYAFTQFESIFARQAFPGFDEPRFKTPFDIVLNVDPGHVAIANTPAVESLVRENGLKRVRFATTLPLPTYLVAIAVGPLDIVEGPVISPNDVRQQPLPFRGVAVQGKGARLDYAMRTTGEILGVLERYFDRPFPYEKLDIIAVPDFDAGAMENAGAITFRESLLLLDEHAPVNQKRRYATVMAHELSHQWFGDLVTPKWWDDIWLNESFATWAMYRTVDEWDPDQKALFSRMDRYFSAMDQDALIASQQIRRPVRDENDILTSFSGITFGKGGYVLTMFESYLGKEVFRDGIRYHLKRFAHATADVNDFLESLSHAAERDIRPEFESFLYQPGIPFVIVEPDCHDGELVLGVTQERYLPLGSGGDPDQSWVLPYCMRYGHEGSAAESCHTVNAKNQSIAVELGNCPDWLMPNAGITGYYHWTLPRAWYDRLVDNVSQLTALEQIGTVRSARAAFFNGRTDAATALNVSRSFATSDVPEVATSPIDLVTFAVERLAVDTELEPAGRLFARELFAGANAARAFDPEFMNSLDSDSQRVFYADIARFLARVGQDLTVRDKARRHGEAVIETGSNTPDLGAVSPELLNLALEVAVQENGAQFFSKIEDRFAASSHTIFRSAALTALAGATDPDLAARGRALAFSDKLRRNEVMSLLYSHVAQPPNRLAAWAWLQQNFDKLLDSLPTRRHGQTPFLVASFCDNERADEIEDFFEPRVEQLAGGRRNLAKSLEAVRLCAAAADHHRPGAATFFSTHAQVSN